MGLETLNEFDISANPGERILLLEALRARLAARDGRKRHGHHGARAIEREGGRSTEEEGQGWYYCSFKDQTEGRVW